MRIVMAIVMAFVVLAAIWFLPYSMFRWFVLAVIAVGAYELARMRFFDRVEQWAVTIAGTGIALAMVMQVQANAVLLLLVGILFALSVIVMKRTPSMDGAWDRIGCATFVLIYLGVAFPYWALLHDLNNGRWWVLIALAPACLCDTAAYVAGKSFGKHKFAAMVSPNKTIEGFFGALVGSLIGTFAIWQLGGQWIPWWHALILAVAMWWVSPFGDLIESMLKRSAGVKDSGTIIKGHGGMMDRLDALIFAGPLVYAYAVYVM